MTNELQAAKAELAAAYAEFPKIGADRGSIIKATERLSAARWAIYLLEHSG